MLLPLPTSSPWAKESCGRTGQQPRASVCTLKKHQEGMHMGTHRGHRPQRDMLISIDTQSKG